MLQDQNVSAATLRLGGIAGIIVFLFLPGVALQFSSGWFPEDALAAGEMSKWIEMMVANKTLALLGVSFSIICILCFFPFALTFYKLLPKDSWLSTAGLSAYMAGIPLVLVAFTMGYGFTWAIIDLQTQGVGTQADLGNIAAMGMRGYLFCDDLGTALLGTGHIFFAIVAMKNRLLPNWLCWEGIIGGALVILVLLRYFIPVFFFASIGYPMIVIFFSVTGIMFLRKAKQIASS